MDSDELQELEPSPVDSPSPSGDSSTYFSQHATSQHSTSTLGLRDHSAIWWLTRIQRYSSYAMSAFFTMHLTNTAVVPLLTRSIPASDTYLLLTRPYYQSPLLEPAVVLAPAAAHIVAGLGLRVARRRQQLRWYAGNDDAKHGRRAERRRIAWPPVSRTSALGMMLAPLAMAHAGINRALPLIADGGSSGVGLGYVAHGVARHPWALRALYAPLVLVTAWHVVWGTATWLGATPTLVVGASAPERARRRSRRWWMINGTAAALAVLWMAGGLGIVAAAGPAGGWQGRLWDDMYRRIPVLGKHW